MTCLALSMSPYLTDISTTETHPATGHPVCSSMNLCFAYDAVICALGWTFDLSIFGRGGGADTGGARLPLA